MAATQRKPRDLWEWFVEYRDGTLIHEYDENGTGRGFGTVDQSQVAAVALVSQVDGLPPHALQIDTTHGKRAIFFRRRSRELNVETGDTITESAIHVLGWQDTVNGSNVSSFTFFLPNGSVLVSDHSEAI